jgi:hypothetical protein
MSGLISATSVGRSGIVVHSETHLECRDALLRDCDSLPEVGTSEQCDLDGVSVIAVTYLVDDLKLPSPPMSALQERSRP